MFITYAYIQRKHIINCNNQAFIHKCLWGVSQKWTVSRKLTPGIQRVYFILIDKLCFSSTLENNRQDTQKKVVKISGLLSFNLLQNCNRLLYKLFQPINSKLIE